MRVLNPHFRNPQLRVEFRGATVTSDAGLLLPRELDDQLRLDALIEHHLSDPRTGHNRQFPLRDLFRQSIYSRLAGYEDTNDAERLAEDPTFRMLASRERRETSVALTSTLHRFEIPDFDIEKTIYFDDAFDRVAELYPGLTDKWRRRLTSSSRGGRQDPRDGRQDSLHALRNSIVHSGNNPDAEGRYAEAIVDTAFPFLEELFQLITKNTVSLPHVLMEWFYQQVKVAQLVLRDLMMI